MSATRKEADTLLGAIFGTSPPARACGACAWWQQIAPPLGKCRRVPPVAHPASAAALWPTTQDSDWCALFARGVGG
jgi:hypothetical protein